MLLFITGGTFPFESAVGSINLVSAVNSTIEEEAFDVWTESLVPGL